MAILNPVALIITVSLVVQIVILFLLTYGYYLKRKQQLRMHGFIMAAAVVLHLSVVFYVMIPSFVLGVIPQYIVLDPLQMVSVISIIHVILGTVSLSLGVWLVVAWRFRRNFQGCFNRKKIMWTTLTVWVSSLIFGIILYVIFIGPLLIS